MTRKRWPWVLITLLLLPVVEIAVFIALGRTVGWWPTLLTLLVIAVAGGWLLRREGPRTWKSLSEAMSGVQVADGVSVQRTPQAPTRELSDGALVLVGGLLLLLPGFATDVLAIICLLPATHGLPRRLFAAWLRGRTQQMMGATRAPVITGVVFDAATHPDTHSTPSDRPIAPDRIIEPPR